MEKWNLQLLNLAMMEANPFEEVSCSWTLTSSVSWFLIFVFPFPPHLILFKPLIWSINHLLLFHSLVSPFFLGFINQVAISFLLVNDGVLPFSFLPSIFLQPGVFLRLCKVFFQNHYLKTHFISQQLLLADGWAASLSSLTFPIFHFTF